jgi:endonuclease YncB( thermonuclease family)
MLIKSKIPFVLSMFIFLSIPNILEAWKGEVIKVVDGNTVLVSREGRTVTLSLDGIDAPEKNQAFSKEAEEFLANMVLNKKVDIQEKGASKGSHTFADVYILKGYKRCVNEELLRNGLAWYDSANSKSGKLSRIEKLARQQKRGLWADPNAISPWEYRNAQLAIKKKAEDEKIEKERRKFFAEKLTPEKHLEQARKTEERGISPKAITGISEGYGGSRYDYSDAQDPLRLYGVKKVPPQRPKWVYSLDEELKKLKMKRSNYIGESEIEYKTREQKWEIEDQEYKMIEQEHKTRDQEWELMKNKREMRDQEDKMKEQEHKMREQKQEMENKMRHQKQEMEDEITKQENEIRRLKRERDFN